MAAAATSSSCHLLLLLRSQPPSPSPSLSSSSSLISSFLKPLLLSSSSKALSSTRFRQFHVPPLQKPLFPSLFSTSSSSSLAFPHPPPLAAVAGSSAQETIAGEDDDEEEDDDDDEEDWVDAALDQDGEETEAEDDELEPERGDFEDAQVGPTSSPLVGKREQRLKLEVPSLTVKEKKELASYAHSLGKKLKSQLVGKSGVTSNLATSFNETLEANELLKIKIHRTCPGELDDAVKQLEELTGSVTVSKIGRTLIIYKPSLTKLKAEEKKKEVRKLFQRKQYKPRVFNKSKEQPKSSGRRSIWTARGSSR